VTKIVDVARRSVWMPMATDAAISRDGRFLYAIDADAQRVFGWTLSEDGRLDQIGEFEGVPATVAGLAAS